MSHSKLISIIRCYNPQKPTSRVCVRNHLIYIGTREGVDLTPLEQSIELFEDHKFTEESSNEQYLKYIAERPNSHGLFGNVNIADPIEFGNKLADYTRNGKNIYRAIVSLRESDALELGFDQKENWVEYIRKVMPDIGREFNIPIDKLEWTAAVHMKKDHPHAHYMFWRSDEKVSSSFIHFSVQNRCRELLSKEMFQEERTQAVLNKTLSRDLILDIGKEFMNTELEYILNGSLGKIPDNIKETDIKEAATSLLEFIPSLPSEGRLAYQLLKPDVKKQLDIVVEKMLEIYPIKKEYESYLNESEKISASYSPTNSKNQRTILRAEYDLKKRLSNQILKTCKTLLQEEKYTQKIVNYAEPTINVPLPEEGEYFNVEDLDASYSFNKDISFRIDNETMQSNNKNAFSYWNDSYKDAINDLYSEEPNYVEVISLLEQEALNKNPLALHDLGKIYEKGLGVDKNPELSFQYYQSAFKIFEKIAKDNTNNLGTYAQYRIGKMYQYGNGTDIDYSKSIHFYKLAVEENYKYAQYSLANMYLYGTGVEITEENKADYHAKALDLFKSSAEQQNPYAAYAYANLAENEFPSISSDLIKNQYSSALLAFEALYSKNQSDDLAYKIGTMYLKGLGCEINIPKSIKYFESAAEFKNHFAYYSLGKIYTDVNSEFYDLERGMEYLKLSHEANNEFATLLIGNLYSNSELPLFDLELALKYLTAENLLNNDFAQYKSGKIYANENFVSFDEAKSIKYFKASALQGNEHAQYALGKIYSDPEKPFYNLDESIKLFSQSAEQGNSFAQYSLGKIYSNEDLPVFDFTKAIDYFTSSALLENEHSQYALGRIYSDPEKPIYNIQEGISWLLKSSEQNNDFAQLALGNIYLWGRPGLKKDEALGKYYINLAMQNNNPYAGDTLKIYENYKASFVIGSAQRMLLNMFSAIATDRRRQTAEQGFQIQTKAQMKMDAKRQGKTRQTGKEEKER